jgi:hypothetical protein
VLVSHRKKFIFTKTKKTAATSVESYFEKYCMPEGEWTFSHAREEYVGKEGIIGYRGGNRRNQTWHNHMSAVKIKDKIGTAIWNSYFKFTVVRNPFDKLISGFYMNEKRIKNYTMAQKLGAVSRKLIRKKHSRDYIVGNSEIIRFRNWIRNGLAAGSGMFDRNKYLINGDICVDFFIRYEDLENGIKYVCDKLDVPFEPENIPRLKSGKRNGQFSISEYYDPEIINIVNKLYEFELNYFGYTAPLIR